MNKITAVPDAVGVSDVGRGGAWPTNVAYQLGPLLKVRVGVLPKQRPRDRGRNALAGSGRDDGLFAPQQHKRRLGNVCKELTTSVACDSLVYRRPTSGSTHLAAAFA